MNWAVWLSVRKEEGTRRTDNIAKFTPLPEDSPEPTNRSPLLLQGDSFALGSEQAGVTHPLDHELALGSVGAHELALGVGGCPWMLPQAQCFPQPEHVLHNSLRPEGETVLPYFLHLAFSMRGGGLRH